jgi:DNA-binding beta-propeller fold protein YncE
MAAAVFLSAASYAQEEEPLKLVQKIQLGHINGQLDHLTIDIKRGRLFLAATVNHTIEVIDIKNGKRLNKMTGINAPQGVLYIPYYDRLVVTSGNDGSCKFYDGNTYNLITTFHFDENADNLFYDPSSEYVYVGHGYGGVAVVDAERLWPIEDISLWGHPEAFQMDYDKNMMFVNVPHAEEISVIDIMMVREVDSIPLKGMKGNYPMALDETGRRLFIAVSSPPSFVVFDMDSYKQVASVTISNDADDMFYDNDRKYIYISSGEGYIDVIKQNGVDSYELAAKLETSPGARTSLFVPELGALYLAVPEQKDQPAAIWVYEAAGQKESVSPDLAGSPAIDFKDPKFSDNR